MTQTVIKCEDWLHHPVEVTTDLDLESIWASREYVGVRVIQGTPVAVGELLAPSVDMPDGDIRHECANCSHAEGGEQQRGDCECGDCDGVECKHDMQPVALDGTCVFYAPTLDDLTHAIREAVRYDTEGTSQIVIIGSDDGCCGHELVPEHMGALIRNAEVLGVLRTPQEAVA